MRTVKRTPSGLVSLGVVVLAFAVQAAAQPPDNSTCTGCHDQGQKIAGTEHGRVACTTCHEKHEDYPHPANIPKPDCKSCHDTEGRDYARGAHGQEVAKGNQAAPECGTCHAGAHQVANTKSEAFRRAIPDTCAMCHDGIAADYRKSVHGKAIAGGHGNAAVCSDCHGEHANLKKSDVNSSVNAAHIRETCGQCHGNVALARRFGMPADRLTTYDASFHGLAQKEGAQTVANCASCHGVHNILASADPNSMVNEKNLPATCGKCHAGAGKRFALGPIHLREGGAGEHVAARYAWLFYSFVIPFTIGLMLLHNFGDWLRKVARAFRGASFARVPAPAGEVRMLGFERLSHALLASSFIVLAWTGLALKFSDQWWVQPLLLGGGLGVRRNIHRIAAVVMTAVSLMHVVSLVWSRPLREHWLDLLPKLRDMTDGIAMFAYNLGLRRTQPQLPHHTYVEKAEYWAVVWGTAVMVLTGALLWLNTWALQLLPKWVLDLATGVHWYEAVLATLAIVVWHFYSVIFDPDVYPMDTAWLTGKSPRRRHEVLEPEPAPQPSAGD